ncbi:TAZ zinc finger family protein [Trichinella spiralis]|uniref:TAZ zinc finger family protein n=1 Tax=Trichinella spiralis TaxID=6334 RepID=UPI0001EFBA9F|nr:TAZ zinc finger family protein [Trichinella spiralis]
MLENTVIFQKLKKFKNTENFGTWKLIIWQLLLLLHARKCPHELANLNTFKAQCILVQCRHAKLILKHIEYCSDQIHCNEPYCRSSKKLLFHWNNCKNDNCDICATVKKTNINQSSVPKQDGQQQLNNSSQQDASKQSAILTASSESNQLSLAESESLSSNINDDSTSPAAVCELLLSVFQTMLSMQECVAFRRSHFFQPISISELEQYFSVKMDDVMRMLGYCCCRSLSYTVMPLPCRGNPSCFIRRNGCYYYYQKIMIRKEKFVILKNNQAIYETFVTCNICSKKWHRICALHHDGIHPEGFCDSGLMSGTFPYRSKAIFAFQIIDDKEICFFGMFVQEYGSSCPPPNSRQIYIAYLDSVKYFEPQNLRTTVYQEILLGYMEYAKSLGYRKSSYFTRKNGTKMPYFNFRFMKVNIWACPSNRNNEYIFYCHPLEQKIPNEKKLQEWYKCLLDKGIMENIIVDYKEMYKHIQDSHFTSVTELPYFEGDWIPEMLENLIMELKKGIQKRTTDVSMIDGPSLAHTIQNNDQKENVTVSQDVISEKQIFEDALLHIKKHRETHFVAILYTNNVVNILKPIDDIDMLISCKLMRTRNHFFSMAKEFKWEFSSMRRTKFSTMAICYRLHNWNMESIAICAKCRIAYASWHCTLCEVTKSYYP